MMVLSSDLVFGAACLIVALVIELTLNWVFKLKDGETSWPDQDSKEMSGEYAEGHNNRSREVTRDIRAAYIVTVIISAIVYTVLFR